MMPGVVCDQCFLSGETGMTHSDQHQQQLLYKNNTVNVNAVEHEEFYSAPDLPEWVRVGNNRTKIKLDKFNLFNSQRLKHLVCCNRVTVTKGE